MLSLKQKKQQEAYFNDIENNNHIPKPSTENVNEKVQTTVENITKTLRNICK